MLTSIAIGVVVFVTSFTFFLYVLKAGPFKKEDKVAALLKTLPKTLRLEPLPDNPRRAAILWGPLVLAGDIGPEDQEFLERDALSWELNVPVFVAADQPVADWLKPVSGKPGHFRSHGVGRDNDVDFMPFYSLHRRTYAAYWDFFTPAEWEQKKAEYADAQEHRRKLDLATVAYVQPGEMQPERDYNYQGEEAQPVRVMGRAGRRGAKWFSFDIPVDPQHVMALIVTYNHDEWRRRTFDILVEGQRIKEQTIERRGPLRFFDVECPVPDALVKGKEKVTVRFQATGGNEIAAVFGIRMIRADVER